MKYIKENTQLKTISHSEYSKKIKWIGECRTKIYKKYDLKTWGVGEIIYDDVERIYISESSEIIDKRFNLFYVEPSKKGENFYISDPKLIYTSTYEENNFDILLDKADELIEKCKRYKEIDKKTKDFNL